MKNKLQWRHIPVLKERSNVHYFTVFTATNCYNGSDLPNNEVFAVFIIFKKYEQKYLHYFLSIKLQTSTA